MKYLARPPEKGYSTRLSDWKDLIAEEKAIPETSMSLYRSNLHTLKIIL